MKKILILIVLSSFWFLSCQKILFDAEESTRELHFEDFHAVKISGIYNVVLIQDSANRMVITGNNDVNSIDALIINDTLVIDDHKNLSFNPAKNTLELHFRSISYMVTYDPVNVSNTGTITAEQFVYYAIGEIAEVRLVIDCNYFLIVNSANTLGNFRINGQADNCTLFNRYGCNIFADSLICRDAEIVNESIGDVYVNASGSIKAYLWGPGNIYYHGSPVVEIAEKRGDGKIIKLN